MTRLSVVVPTLDEAPRIEALARALHDQTAPGDELIVADGGSSDGTAARARAMGLERLRVLEGPRGRAAQMNQGAGRAQGDWLVFLHADSRVCAGTLDAVRRVRDASWGHFRLRLDDPSLAFRCIELGINLRSRIWHTPSGDQGLFVRRALFESLGGFPDAPLLEDLLLVDRLHASGAPARPRCWLGTSARRWQQAGTARTVLRMWALRAAFRLGVDPARLARHYPSVR